MPRCIWCSKVRMNIWRGTLMNTTNSISSRWRMNLMKQRAYVWQLTLWINSVRDWLQVKTKSQMSILRRCSVRRFHMIRTSLIGTSINSRTIGYLYLSKILAMSLKRRGKSLTWICKIKWRRIKHNRNLSTLDCRWRVLTSWSRWVT